ncbi:MAG: PepSY-like domain-containing protein [Bacteroidetes bacterium]|nr:PepSY-like domain-containing protein [Bacteroidota bacterium]
MRKIVVVMAVVITSFATAQKMQEKDVPAPVKGAIQKQYPKATKVKWAKEGDKYEAGFDLGKEETSLLIDASGTILETEVEIEISQLPKKISAYIKANYSGQSIKEAAKITDAKGSVTYEAEIKGKDLIFDSKGEFIKETKD